MSWSVMAKGKPSDVKEALAHQFKNCKDATASYETETKTVELAEQICNATLDQMIESDFPEVHISGFGSSTQTNPEWKSKGNTQFSLTITPVNVKV